jgi:D-amino-acid dehydrogenase
MLPDLDTQEESVWMGCRPSLPDSLPVISPSSVSKNIIYAFGHQHLGMTLGPVTAFLVEQMVTGEKTKTDLHPYRINRFKSALS